MENEPVPMCRPAGDPPDTVRTLGAWIEWRRAEDARMFREIEEFLRNFFVLLSAPDGPVQ